MIRQALSSCIVAISVIGGAIQPALAQEPPPPPPPPQTPPQTPAGLSSKVFNPDISVIGNFVALAGKNSMSEEPSLSLAEVEVAFQAVVDAYARADFFVALSPEGAEVEEGFITFTSLPANLLLKAGKMRAQFGKLNTLHTHRLPSVNRSLVTDNLLGGEEGLSDAGLSLAYLANNPALFLEFIGEVYRGASEVYQTSRNGRLNYVGRVRAYHDLTEDKNLDGGVSFSWGPTDFLEGPIAAAQGEDGEEIVAPPIELGKRLIGVDLTFRYRPLARAIYRRLNLRTELIWSQQDRAGLSPEAEAKGDVPVKAFGFYAMGEYQFARRWYIGARGDRSGRVLDGDAVDIGASVFLTFWPTEFSQIRSQYRWTKYAEDVSGNEFLFQFNFSIGAHGAHIF